MTKIQRLASRRGFTLIEILVVIVIIGVLATMGVSKYTEFTTDSRRSTCISNQTGVDKGVGVWESQKVAISKASKATITFNAGGDITAASGVPTGLNTNAPTTTAKDNNNRSIAAYIRDDNIFVCPEYASQNGGLTAISRTGTDIYMWLSDVNSYAALNNNRRGVICLQWGGTTAGATKTGPDGTDKTGHH